MEFITVLSILCLIFAAIIIFRIMVMVKRHNKMNNIEIDPNKPWVPFDYEDNVLNEYVDKITVIFKMKDGKVVTFTEVEHIGDSKDRFYLIWKYKNKVDKDNNGCYIDNRFAKSKHIMKDVVDSYDVIATNKFNKGVDIND